MVPHEDRVAHGLEGHHVGGAGHEARVGRPAQGDDELVVRDLVRIAAIRCNLHLLRVQVDPLDLRLHEVGALQIRADGGDGVARVEDAAAAFEQQGRHDEEVVAADECDLDLVVRAQDALEVLRDISPPNPPPRMRM